ncbi:hypothetical protein StrepF001_42305 [Streptomyces sp. F001]|uniref:hypothetical protein n=1 Tax=Streptomyces sp. F001 TaxID=1510026 RepID=UPI00101E58EC|nr:hypothetical protein [Streptomyces sp. F001]RZB13779.1 hypothetical protein StrepF001_42305 [Streptomyces sp. F001]
MGEISDRIEALVATRHGRLAEVDTEIGAWSEAEAGLARIAKSLEAPTGRAEGAAAEEAAVLAGLRSEVAATLEDLRAARCRFVRPTINIGVSGKARVGKSTLLQSVSGLSDDQIPTGPHVPVTAVRSRIMQSDRRRVLLRMHSPESFLADVVAPYHQDLGLEGMPRTVEEFRHWTYPRPDPDDPSQHSDNALLVNLRSIQASLDSYADLLTGSQIERGLEGLRPFVAYPTREEVSAGTTHRPHLAVREAIIESPFPHGDVSRLVVVDLPGLGEVASGAEERHVRDLRHDVDAVLLVVRPSTTAAYYTNADDRALKLLDKARGHVRTPGHYVHFVINHGGESTGGIEALRNDLRTRVNASTDGGFYQVLETNAIDPAVVNETLLIPLLESLSRTLPEMDDEVYSGVMARAADAARRISEALPQLLAGRAGADELAHLEQELLQQRAAELRWKVDQRLRAVVEELWRAAHRDGVDERYTNAVEAVFDEVRAWAEDGFGKGTARWQEEARLIMPTERAASPFLVEEMHRVRVEVTRRFRSLDDFFNEQLARTWEDIAEAFREPCAPLLGKATGKQALHHLEGRLRASSCPVLADAVRDLLQTRLDYRTHLHPRVREELDGFSFEGVDPDTGRPRVALLAPADEAGVELLEQQLRERTHKAAFETMVALQREAVLPALVLYAAVKQFEDELILSADSRREFLRLARNHRDLLWPDDFGQLEASAKRAHDLAELAHGVGEALARHAARGDEGA